MTTLDTNRQTRAVALMLAIVGAALCFVAWLEVVVGAVLCVVGWLEWARVG
jgi:uncharacterized membrane protein